MKRRRSESRSESTTRLRCCGKDRRDRSEGTEGTVYACEGTEGTVYACATPPAGLGKRAFDGVGWEPARPPSARRPRPGSAASPPAFAPAPLARNRLSAL